MASLVMTSLLLSQGVAYTNYDAEKEVQRKIDQHYNGNGSSAARQSMENLEKQINRNIKLVIENFFIILFIESIFSCIY